MESPSHEPRAPPNREVDAARTDRATECGARCRPLFELTVVALRWSSCRLDRLSGSSLARGPSATRRLPLGHRVYLLERETLTAIRRRATAPVFRVKRKGPGVVVQFDPNRPRFQGQEVRTVPLPGRESGLPAVSVNCCVPKFRSRSVSSASRTRTYNPPVNSQSLPPPRMSKSSRKSTIAAALPLCKRVASLRLSARIPGSTGSFRG